MAEYIEREAALKKQIGVVVYDEGGWDANVRAVPVEDIEAIPAADVAPVVHGRWVHGEHYPSYCSICGEVSPMDCEGERFYDSNYCPNCGAKMDEEVRDNA